MNCRRNLDHKQVLYFGVELFTRCELHQADPRLQEYFQGLQTHTRSQLLPHDYSYLDDIAMMFVY